MIPHRRPTITEVLIVRSSSRKFISAVQTLNRKNIIEEPIPAMSVIDTETLKAVDDMNHLTDMLESCPFSDAVPFDAEAFISKVL